MCRFKSGIILKNKIVIAPKDNDSHSDLLESLGIEDNYIGASRKFVRAELVPKSTDEWWINPAENPEKWEFVVDQDIVPDWFDKEVHEKEFREAVCAWWKAHVFIDEKLEELRTGYYLLKRCEVKRLRNDVRVTLNSSQINRMWDSSQVNLMQGDSQVGEMHDNSRIIKMRDNSQINKMLNSSQINKMLNSSQINKMLDSSRICNMYDRSRVGEMYGNSRIGEMFNKSIARDFKNYPLIKILVPDDKRFKIVAHKNEND